MGGRVAENGVALLDEGRDKAEVGRVTGGEDERLLHSHPVGQQLLQLRMEGQGAIEQAAAGDTRAIAGHRVHGRFLYPWVGRQPEVVVRAQHYDLGPGVPDGGADLTGQLPVEGVEAQFLCGPVVVEGAAGALGKYVGRRGPVAPQRRPHHWSIAITPAHVLDPLFPGLVPVAGVLYER